MPKKRNRRLVLKQIRALDIIQNYYYELKEDNRTTLLRTNSSIVNSKNVIYFIDPHKNTRKYLVSMVDVHDYGSLPIYTSKPCWWCRHRFNSCPIGLPLEYYSHEAASHKKIARDAALTKANLPLDMNDFFITDGLFCSFPCCKSFKNDCRDDIKYRDSLTLLLLLYTKLTNRTLSTIPEAPHWKLLKAYGGHLTIEEFRQTFGKLEYIQTPNIKRPYMYTCSSIVQEQPTNDSASL